MGGRLWPWEGYARQVEALRAAVGKRIYLAEIVSTDIHLGVRLSDSSYELVDIVGFPRPDPARGIAPHLVLLDDGRGVNLGRIARITLEHPFNPSLADLLYQDALLMQKLLFRERTFSEALVADRSRSLLGEILEKGKAHRLTQASIDPSGGLAPER